MIILYRVIIFYLSEYCGEHIVRELAQQDEMMGDLGMLASAIFAQQLKARRSLPAAKKRGNLNSFLSLWCHRESRM